jgi:DHA2 family multidrug resistance protein
VAAFAFVPREKTNYGTGLINLARNIGASVGIATVAALLERRAQFHQQALAGHVTPYDPAYRSMVDGTAGHLMVQGSSAAQASAQAHGIVYSLLQRQSAMLAFVDDFWLLGVVFLAVIPLMLLMKKTKPVEGPVTAH